MSGVTGSCIADAAMNTRLLGPAMLKRGFSKGYAAGVLSFGSLMAPIIPPGIGFILYGTVGQVSIGRLFAAGVIPGFLLWAALAATISFTARKRGYKPERTRRPSLRELGGAAWGGIWATCFPVILLAGPALRHLHAVGDRRLRRGLRGRHRRRRLPQARPRQISAKAIEGSLIDVGSVMFLLALSAIFGYGIVFERVPEAISAGMLSLTDSPQRGHGAHRGVHPAGRHVHGGSVLIIMLTPIFLPLVTQYGIDPVHFGLVFIIAATIGNFTPPVGAAMFVVCQILRCPIGVYTRESMPFLLAVSAVSLLLIFVPEVVLWLPDWIFGKDLW